MSVVPALYAAHLSHVWYHSDPAAGSVMLCLRSRNWTLSPPPTWKAMWQCISHAPGIVSFLQNSRSVQDENGIHTWVISRIRKHQPAPTRQLRDITSRRVIEDELVEVVSHTKRASTLTQDICIMAVKVNRVRDGRRTSGLLNDPIRPRRRRGRRNLHDIVRCGRIGILRHDFESRVPGVNDHGRAVDGPENEVVLHGDGTESYGKRLGLRSEGGAGHCLYDFGGCDGIDAGSGWVRGCEACWICERCALVGKDGKTTLVGTRLAYAVGVGAEPVIACSLVCSKDNIVALTNADGEVRSGVWIDGHKVGGNDLERVTVEVDSQACVDRGVDQAKPIFLAALDCHFVVCARSTCALGSAVDQDIVRWWWPATGLAVDECLTSCLENCLVVPIAHRHDAKIHVVVGGSWSVDLHRTDDAITVLMGEMTVIPCGAVLGGLELIGLDVARSQRTFRNAVCTVLGVGIQHTKPMPVDRCTVMLKHIADWRKWYD
jgi:hypothetical protein